MQNLKESKFNVWEENENKLYLINTFTKSILEIDKKEKNKIDKLLKGEIKENKYKNYLKILYSNGFLVKEDIDEIKLLKYFYEKEFYRNDLSYITFIPTMKCNFKCPYCFELKKELEINDENLNILKLFFKENMKNKKYLQIGLFGGEPLLKWDYIKELFDYILKLKEKYNFIFDTTLTTNGYLLNEKIIKDLIYLYNCKSIQITIDVNEKIHNKYRILKNNKGTFNIVLNNFKKLLKLKNKSDIKPVLRVNVLNIEVKDLNPLFKEFDYKEKDKFEIYFRPIYETSCFHIINKNKNNLEDFYIYAKNNGFKILPKTNFGITYCEADRGENTIVIMPDLTIWKCINDLDFDKAKVGKILDNGIIDYNYSNIEFWSRKNPFTDKKCIECKYLPLCFGSCPLLYAKYNKRKCFYEVDFKLTNLFLKNK